MRGNTKAIIGTRVGGYYELRIDTSSLAAGAQRKELVCAETEIAYRHTCAVRRG